VVNFIADAGFSASISLELGYNRGLGTTTFFGSSSFTLGNPGGDYDSDGVANSADNCPATANSSQADCDADGLGDACETDPDLNLNGIRDNCEPPGPLVFDFPANFGSVQAAIAAAPNGSIIRLAAGTFAQRIDLAGKNLVVEGTTSGDSLTILDGSTLGAGSVVKAVSGENATAVIRNLVIRNATGGTAVPGEPGIEGGAGLAIIGSSPTVENVTIEDCSAEVGAGILLVNSSSRLAAVTLRDCDAAMDGGGAIAIGGSPRFEDLALDGNAAGGFGGGLAFEGGSSVVDGAAVTANAAGTGGGMSFLTSGGGATLRLEDVSITGNDATSAWGGLWMSPGFAPTLSLLGTEICDNDRGNINVTGWTDLGGNDVCSCSGDINGDRVVDAADIASLLGAWGPCSGGPCSLADFNFDGVVNANDIAILLGAWGACP
jgi:hypothetical protein